eukprot:CAMPEP_0114246432 /NCGR_PEP_ID=MMETSP0058-20121206/12458_1 /TAXON_ID=36894 /ORGANISM="Pyramimonas parkeae, CCMP726" /LENGTH=133 /DNA_ID=CAMNT_0001359615 /DNA_START=70 /DNA_END=471 /DNA_ORIENTATION=+
MTGMAVTSLVAGLGGCLFLVLTRNVIVIRRKEGIGSGDGGNKLLQRRIRAQANFCESFPVAMILLATLEAADVVSDGSLYTLGGMFMLGRLMHAKAFSSEKLDTNNRVGGMISSTLSIVGMTILALLHGLHLL